MPLNKTPDYLIRGEDFLEEHAHFECVARDSELKKLSAILMRHRAHSVLLVGSGGVGCTALCLGLQDMKGREDMPFDIMSKRLFWLDVDALFSSGDQSQMNTEFSKLVHRMSRMQDSVLILEDTRVFVESARSNGATHLINVLMREIRAGSFRVIFEARDRDLEIVLRCHSDIGQFFTVMDLSEPHGDALDVIVATATQRLVAHHGISIDEAAIETAVELTSKYRVDELSLSRAQPERALNLIDRALTSYRQRVHVMPPHIEALKQEVYLASSDEEQACAQEKLQMAEEQWNAYQDKLRKTYKEQLRGERLLQELEDELEEIRDDEQQSKERSEEPERPDDAFTAALELSGFESKAVNETKEKIRAVEDAIKKNSDTFAALTREVNQNLSLSSQDILLEFSALSGIPTDKLNQDERQKLLNLEGLLSERVYGQAHAINKLAGAVRVARAGLQERNRPQASFMFLGPSGVGKTELAKTLAAILKDDERALLRFDMSEYMEKHAAAKLIGAPPGYEGYEAGGVLTNAMRRNPHVVILFDEIEKAHPDVFNIFLQVLDDGRLTDNRGLTVSFNDAIVLMTTNIGQRNFLQGDLSYEEAVAETMKELDEVYRPEFLNRFNGRENIVCFNRLDLAIIERIAQRELGKLNARVKQKNAGLSVSIDPDELTALCRDKYNPLNGARGIAGYFNSNIYPAIAHTLISNPEASGKILVHYCIEGQQVRVEPQLQPQSGQASDAV